MLNVCNNKASGLLVYRLVNKHRLRTVHLAFKANVCLSVCILVLSVQEFGFWKKIVTVIVVRNNDGNRLGITERCLEVSVFAANKHINCTVLFSS